jgi:hypothetical protein
MKREESPASSLPGFISSMDSHVFRSAPFWLLLQDFAILISPHAPAANTRNILRNAFSILKK